MIQTIKRNQHREALVSNLSWYIGSALDLYKVYLQEMKATIGIEPALTELQSA